MDRRRATLHLLEDEGLVTGEEQDGKRVYTITDAGRAELEERRARGGAQEPWEEFGPVGQGLGQLRESGFQLASAAMQVARTGSEPQRKQAAEILAGGPEEAVRLARRGLMISAANLTASLVRVRTRSTP